VPNALGLIPAVDHANKMLWALFLPISLLDRQQYADPFGEAEVASISPAT